MVAETMTGVGAVFASAEEASAPNARSMLDSFIVMGARFYRQCSCWFAEEGKRFAAT
jgi:hypothetical protein